MNQNKRFKYPIGKCKSIKCGEGSKVKKLLGYSWFNIQIIDNGNIYPSGEKEKVPTCLECYLYQKPMMEDKMAEEKIKYPAIIPYKWFYFYNGEDEKKYPNNWERRYEKHLAKREIWKKFKDKDCNSIRKVPEYQAWQEKFKDCLSWDEKPYPLIKDRERK